jgi:hypothetical protein
MNNDDANETFISFFFFNLKRSKKLKCNTQKCKQKNINGIFF